MTTFGFYLIFIPYSQFKEKTTILTVLILPLLAVMAMLGVLHPPTINAAPDGTQTVTTLADSGAGSLRQTIADATAGDTVEFSISGTILLTTQLVIDKDLTINGGNMITISGNNVTRVFKVISGTVTFDRLTIANGNDQSSDCLGSSSCGGGILIQNSNVIVMIMNSTLVSNTAHVGGGIFNQIRGTVIINNSTLSNNSANSFGGGIYNYHGTMMISNSTLFRNED